MAVIVTGVERVKANLRVLAGQAGSEMRQALENEARRILDKASPITPRDTGNLRRSAHTVDRPSPPGRPEVWAQMGGEAESGDASIGEEGTNEEDVFYAWLQHERMDFAHSVGGPKFLLRAMMRRKAKMHEDIGNDVSRLLLENIRGT